MNPEFPAAVPEIPVSERAYTAMDPDSNLFRVFYDFSSDPDPR
jgi:hypothetical protein